MMMSIRVSSSWHRELNPDKGWLQRQIAAWKVFFKMLSKGHLECIQSNLQQATTQNAKIAGAYRRRSWIEPQGVYSNKWPQHIYFLAENFCSSILSLKNSSYPLSGQVPDNASRSFLQEIKDNEKL